MAMEAKSFESWKYALLGIARLILGEAETESGPFFQSAVYPNSAAMALDDMSYDGKPQAGTSELPGTILVYAIEALKNAVQVFSGYPDSRIRHSDMNFIPGIQG
jgi:hypothetical protein